LPFLVPANVRALAMWRHSVFRLPVAAADQRYKSSYFILQLGFIRLLGTEAE